MQRIGETENVVGSIVALHRVPALAERKRAAEFADDLMAISHHPLGGQCDLMRPVAIDHPWAQFAFAPRHVLAQPKSSGTSPKVLRITASSNSPMSGLPLRENATAPALASSRDRASARRIAAAA
jgi:hypothetical protein